GATVNTISRSGIGRLRLEPDDEQSSRPVLRGLGFGNGARLPDQGGAAPGGQWPAPDAPTPRRGPSAAARLVL
ncbi:hypothetical protein, partial [Microvirga tunisiensis]|uniref:hypothetical protein n=1 Tax=Microvirga tunisiensis TaxID=2108360 RepID=UPI001AEF2847